jgi:hypothetical protein
MTIYKIHYFENGKEGSFSVGAKTEEEAILKGKTMLKEHFPDAETTQIKEKDVHWWFKREDIKEEKEHLQLMINALNS